ncbi:MAG: hypothetical protein COA67_11070 [Lutibacter sp.]|nr:MAG: hypothetical protein COA67_11070 [Lutibacter sp.]
MKNILFILIALCTLQYSYGQKLDNKTKNKIRVKYITAKDFYTNKEYYKVLTKIGEIEGLSNGVKSANVQNLKVKTYVDLEEFITAQEELDILQEMNLSSKIIEEMAKYTVTIEDNIEIERQEAAVLKWEEEKRVRAEEAAEKERLRVDEEKRLADEKREIRRSKFDYVGEFHFGLAIVRVKGKSRNIFGYVNEDYEIVIPLQYESAGKFSKSGFAYISKDVGPRIIDGEFHLPKPKKGLIDRTGKVIVPMLYDKIGMHKGNFHVVKDGLIGIYTDKGIKLMDAICDSFYESSITKNGTEYFILAKEGKQILIHKVVGNSGSIISQGNSGFIYDDIKPLKSKNKTFGFRVKYGALYGILDQNGEEVLNCLYNKITMQDDDSEQTYFYRVESTFGDQTLYNSNHELVSGEKNGVPYEYNHILWTQNEYTGIVILYAGKSKYECSFRGTQFNLDDCESKDLTKEEKKQAKKNGWIKKSWWTTF